MNIKESTSYLFNWKKNPSSVFFFALPLAAIGFFLLFVLGAIHLVVNNDPWYLVVLGFGMGLFVFGLWPIRKFLFTRS